MYLCSVCALLTDLSEVGGTQFEKSNVIHTTLKAFRDIQTVVFLVMLGLNTVVFIFHPTYIF